MLKLWVFAFLLGTGSAFLDDVGARIAVVTAAIGSAIYAFKQCRAAVAMGYKAFKRVYDSAAALEDLPDHMADTKTQLRLLENRMIVLEHKGGRLDVEVKLPEPAPPGTDRSV